MVVCAGADAATKSASLSVSVSVPGQCLVHTTTPSANCSAGAAYAVGVSRERVATLLDDQLTASDEHAHTSGNGPFVIIPQSVQGVASDVRGAADLVPIGSVDGPSIEAIRITYSF